MHHNGTGSNTRALNHGSRSGTNGHQGASSRTAGSHTGQHTRASTGSHGNTGAGTHNGGGKTAGRETPGLHNGAHTPQSKGETAQGGLRRVVPIKGDGHRGDGLGEEGLLGKNGKARGDAAGQEGAALHQEALNGKEGRGDAFERGGSHVQSRAAVKLYALDNSSGKSDGATGAGQGADARQAGGDDNPAVSQSHGHGQGGEGAAAAAQANNSEMAPNQHAHAFSPEASRKWERDQKNANGSRAGGVGKAKLAAYMNQQMGGSEERSFSDTMAHLMQHMAPGLDVRSSSFSLQDTHISKGPVLSIKVTFAAHSSAQGSHGGAEGTFTRSLDFEAKTARHEYFQLPAGEQGAGTGKNVLASQIALYKSLKFERVELHANINVGGYAWAKYGFHPQDGEWNKLSQYFSRQLDSPRFNGVDAATKDATRAILSQSDPKALWALSDSRLGKSLMLGCSWNGYLNLKDPEAMERFDAYVGRR